MYLLYTKNPLFTMWGFRGDNYFSKSCNGQSVCFLFGQKCLTQPEYTVQDGQSQFIVISF